MNESHHWSLRDAPDVVAVVAAYLAAYNARAAGVRDYVQQLMFNNPPSTSPAMDLGKMLAKLELVESLQGEHFRVWRETRGGLTSYPPDPHVACGHLAATVALQMQLKPHVVHIVGHTEAHHATTAAELIQACRIADGVISQCLLGLPDMTADVRVQRRKAELLADAALLLDAVTKLAPDDRDPYTDPETLARAVEIGLLDAPHLRGNAAGCGKVVTGMVGGACLAMHWTTGAPLGEAERITGALAVSADPRYPLKRPADPPPRSTAPGTTRQADSTAPAFTSVGSQSVPPKPADPVSRSRSGESCPRSKVPHRALN
jgi:hypothetical protein